MTNDEARKWAEIFHKTYETLAPNYGYRTRKKTRAFDPDSPNGRLMIVTCSLVVDAIKADLLRKIQQAAVPNGEEGKR